MGNTNEDRYLSERGLDEYDALLKQYIDSEETLAYKTVLKSTDANENTLLLFYKKPNATLSDTPDKTITITGGGGAGGGHIIIDASGTALPQEDNLQFAGYLQTTDDSTNGKTVVDDSPTEVEYSVWETMTTAQKEGKKWIIKNYPGGGGGSGGGHIIVDASGTALPQQPKLQFGDYLKATNDSTNGITKVEDNVETIAWTDYQALTDAQRAGRHFIITDAPTPTLEATRVTYDNTGSGTSADNVQEAIDDKANRNDLTSINETGTTASQAISAGTYFYLDGILVMAKTDIASGATFTENTNYEVVTAGGLNTLATIQTGTFTSESGFTPYYTSVRKCNNVVTFIYEYNGNPFNSTSRLVGVLPVGFRPPYRIIGPVVGDNFSGTISGYGRLTISPNGGVSIAVSYTGGSFIQAAITFIV